MGGDIGTADTIMAVLPDATKMKQGGEKTSATINHACCRQPWCTHISTQMGAFTLNLAQKVQRVCLAGVLLCHKLKHHCLCLKPVARPSTFVVHACMHFCHSPPSIATVWYFALLLCLGRIFIAH
jgi:hypothetical protein